MDIDAPRILAHCFLYELDKFLENRPQISFVRFMDDVNVGVNTVEEAKTVVRDMDLLLQTRQIRLNSGKTSILRAAEAETHFMIRENVALDSATETIIRKEAKRLPLDRERKYLRRFFFRYYKSGKFDQGNGEKILKRFLRIIRHCGGELPIKILRDIIRLRPACRSSVFGFIASHPLTPNSVGIVREFIIHPMRVEDYSCLSAAHHLVEGCCARDIGQKSLINSMISHISQNGIYGLAAALWLASKYLEADEFMMLVSDTKKIWSVDVLLGRLVGGLLSRMTTSADEKIFEEMVLSSGNHEAVKVLKFHQSLMNYPQTFNGVRKIISAPNQSKPLAISHSIFL